MTFPRMGQGFQNPSEIIANIVVVEGSNAGIFFYSGTPAPGNPPILAITTATHDPYGNTVAQNAISDASLPLLMYLGSIGAGNLRTSISPFGGDTTDSFGNTVKAGFFSGNLGVPGAGFVQVVNGLITLGLTSEIAGGLQAGITAGIVAPGILQIFSDLASGTDAATIMNLNSKTNGGLITFVAGRDAITYTEGRLSLQSANSVQSITSTTPTLVTGLSAALGIGRYKVKAEIVCQQGGGAFGQALQLASSGTSSRVIGWSRQVVEGSPPATWGEHHHGSLPANFTGPAHAALGTFVHTIVADVTFSTAGTIEIDAFEGTATHQFTILASGGSMDIYPC